MSALVKLEHYVPRFYLRNFSIKNDGKAVFCFDKTNSKKFIANIRNIACEKYFYDFPKRDKTAEKALAKTEAIVSSAYDKLIETCDLNKLTWAERVSIANFVSIQEIRTKEMREMLADMTRRVIKLLSMHKLSKELEKELERIRAPEYPQEFQMRMFANVKKFSDIILSMKWILAENKTETPFWTSDHPINRYNPYKDPLGNLGYLSKGIQIFFPLNPRLSLLLCDIVDYFPYADKIVTDKKDNIIFQNHLQMRWSTRFVFSQDADFSLAEEILRREPILRNGDRRRIVANLYKRTKNNIYEKDLEL